MKYQKTLIIQKDGSTYYKNWKIKKKNFFLLNNYNFNLNWKIKKYTKIFNKQIIETK